MFTLNIPAIHFSINLIELLFKLFQLVINSLIIAWIVQRLIEEYRKPNLNFEIQKEEQLGHNEKGYWKFVNIIIKNNKRKLSKYIFGNSSADNMTAYVIFRDYDTKIELKRIIARWNELPQPLNENLSPNYNLALVNNTYTLPIDSSVSIAVALKTNKSKYIYEFNNQNYLAQNNLWMYFKHKVGTKDKYKIEVSVITNGHTFTKNYVLINPNDEYGSIFIKEQIKNL